MTERVVLWRLLVEPLKAKEKTEGGILLPTDTAEADKIATCVGKVLQVGHLAYKSKPRPGLDYEADPAIPQVGEYVIYARHSGQKVKYRDGREIVVLNDTDVLIVTDEPNEVIGYV